MPPSRVSTASRSRTVTLRGGSTRRGSSVRSTTSTRTGYVRGAPRYYLNRRVTRTGLPVRRRVSSWQPAVTRSKMDIPKYIIANHNAFHSSAEGVKVPDMNAMPSATSFSREIISPQTNAQGFSITAYRFQQSLTTVNGTPLSGQPLAAAWPAMGTSANSPGFGVAVGVQQDPAIASMIANYLDVRTVACSLRVQCTLPALTAQGFVHMAVVPEDMSSNTTAWQYPTTFSAMERAPFYQKVPLANLINNTPTIALPIMDEGAWRYRNVNLLPTQVGQSFLQSTVAQSTTPVQITQTGVVTTDSTTGNATVTYPFAFTATPEVEMTINTGGTTSTYTVVSTAQAPTAFSLHAEQDGGGSVAAANLAAVPVQWEATGLVTPANAALFYTSIGAQQPLSSGNVQSVQIPGIETAFGWGAIIIALENVGTANGISPIEIEVIRHYEAIPNDSSGNVITGTKAAPNCPEVLTLNKAVQDENGPISILPDTGLDANNDRGFVANFQKCASWVSGVSGALGSFHPALSVVSAVTGAMAGRSAGGPQYPPINRSNQIPYAPYRSVRNLRQRAIAY